jgi:hypothetical protein
VLLNVTWLAEFAPNATVLAFVNPVPVIVTEVPPATGPVLGLTIDTVGAAMYVNWSAALVLLVPFGVVTVMWTVPADPGGEVAVIWVAVLLVMLAAVAPNLTEVAPDRLVPVIVTEVPPAVGPDDGLT